MAKWLFFFFLNGLKTLQEKEKMPVTSIFFFSQEKMLLTGIFPIFHNVLRRPLSGGRKNFWLCGKGLSLSLSQTMNFRPFQTERLCRQQEKGLTHYHTMPHFDTLKIYRCGKHCEKRRNCLSQAISPFLTMFSTLYGTYFSFYMHFEMSSVNCFNFDQFKILSSNNGLKGWKEF